MIIYGILVVIVFYSAGYYDSEESEKGGGFFWGLVICSIGFLFYLRLQGDNGLVSGANKPKFYIKETVQLPDSSFGKIDSVYYKVEDKIYNQKILREE